MDKPLGIHSLSWKIILVLAAAIASALTVALGTLLLGRLLVDTYYSSPQSVNQRLDWEMETFQNYVQENQLVSTDMRGVEEWNLEHPNVAMTVYGNGDTVILSDRLGASLLTFTGQLMEQAGIRTDDRREYSILFADGAFTVGVCEYPQDRLYSVVNVTALALASLVFLSIVLWYLHQVTVSIQRIGRQVRQVSRGNLQTAITPRTQDEIGQLARDVDTMRLSIIDQLQREEQAWQANSQLITALSHDVRTPLTAIVGYLDILSEDTLPPQLRREYLQVCTKQAQRLKDLTNELLGFFLVFGQSKPQQTLETFDAQMLLDQILGEQLALLRSAGLDVRHVPLPVLEGEVTVDLGHLRRVFDNLFSNIAKYADGSKPVTILETLEEGRLHVCLSNYIPQKAPRVESTKIGLQTCRKLLQAMGGEFVQLKTRDQFTAEVILPLKIENNKQKG